MARVPATYIEPTLIYTTAVRAPGCVSRRSQAEVISNKKEQNSPNLGPAFKPSSVEINMRDKLLSLTVLWAYEYDSCCRASFRNFIQN